MEITLFCKKRKTKEGKSFDSFLAKLTKKGGTQITASVRFREECGQPKGSECPCNIVIEKGQCNMSEREWFNDETGEISKSYTLWITGWERGSEYVDHSMDDFF